MNKKNILFLELPLVDTDANAVYEHAYLAGVYLAHSVRISPESSYYRPLPFPPSQDSADDSRLIAAVNRLKPAVIAATLYLWNIERTLDLLKKIKKTLPGTAVIVGGPEVAPDHPFLFRAAWIDAAVTGEGETVFPLILNAVRSGKKTDLTSVAWRTGNVFVRGTKPPPLCDLAVSLPHPRHTPWYRPDAHGMAFIETVRGCPMRCTFCAYGHGRAGISFLPAPDVIDRIGALLDKGARQIRIIDPTFNAHPQFRSIVAGIAALNKAKKTQFFAELHPETITADDARLLARARFKEIEVGVQSRNVKTLAAIKRPTDFKRVDRGIKCLGDAGIRVTVDLMLGLPGQTFSDIKDMLEWSRGLLEHIQWLQTLLLPGSEIRSQAARFGARSSEGPPYLVRSTSTLSEAEIVQAEYLIRRYGDVELDSPTGTFVGFDLPDLFKERVTYRAPFGPGSFVLKGKANRRAVIFSGRCLYAYRAGIIRTISRALKEEPHILWQFVLESGIEEPLDLFDELYAAISRYPMRVQDRFIQVHSPGKLCSRRILVRLKKKANYSVSWRNALTALLKRYFV
ncbi:MAG: radical SAM protein [Candidatus Omnitrophica bacterium]|nr:radical SAM protein [Candidatus Omnitrophota bacterium]